jgi:hypothetical protein
MALKDYEASREKVGRIQIRLNNAVDQIRNNRRYTEDARRAEMATATLKAKKDAAALKAEFLAERDARRESLEKRLFGILGTPDPTELMVLRDARDRAASITSEEEADTKLRLANQAGDTYMARAIAQVAITKGWRPVVNTFAETAPLGTKTALEELGDIPSGRNTKLADNSTFSIRNPAELGSADDGRLEVIARSDPAEIT